MGIFDRFKSKSTSVNQQNSAQAPQKIAMPWQPLIRPDQIKYLLNHSYDQRVLVFKHSTRCIISSMVLRAIESSAEQLAELGSWQYLDLIEYRECSNQVAKQFGVVHQSPQLIVLKNGAVLWEASHQSISPETILAALTSA